MSDLNKYTTGGGALGGPCTLSSPHPVDQCGQQASPETPTGQQRRLMAEKAAEYERAIQRGEVDPYWTPKEETIQGPVFGLIRHLERKIDRLKDQRARLQNEINSLQPEIATLEEVIRLFR